MPKMAAAVAACPTRGSMLYTYKPVTRLASYLATTCNSEAKAHYIHSYQRVYTPGLDGTLTAAIK